MKIPLGVDGTSDGCGKKSADEEEAFGIETVSALICIDEFDFCPS
jgi:hypothetical protein